MQLGDAHHASIFHRALSTEVLDIWNRIATPVPGAFTLVKKTAYFHADKDGRSIPLPGKPYMAIRIKRVRE